MVSKNTYYLEFTTEQFLAGKELLKSMPVFFNRVYFSKKYANALWNGEANETFSNIAMLCKKDDIASLRQIIKNNFLYISDWDSLKFTEDDYGFSFIGGNIKYIVIPFTETETGYEIKSYDVNTGECSLTKVEDDKQFFLDTSINDRGEFVRTCAFNLEDINDKNTTKKIAELKVQPKMAVYDNKGYALANLKLVLLIIIIAAFVCTAAYFIVKFLLAQANI